MTTAVVKEGSAHTDAHTDLTALTVPLPPAAQNFARVFRQAEDELHKVIVGLDEVLLVSLAGAFTSSHVLLQGIPGLAKTLLAKNIARVLGLEFRRQQFTTDLMPADITGCVILPLGASELIFSPGPIFTNVFMADEINRTPQKTQSALLEGMEEHQVTIAGVTHKLPEPFFVIATQNEIGTPGTFPLPHAQIDRFAIRMEVPLPNEDELIEINHRTTNGYTYNIIPVIDPQTACQEILGYKEAIYSVGVSEEVERGIAKTILALCPGNPKTLDEVAKYVDSGPLVRAMQSLTVLAKTFAILNGRLAITVEDVVRAAKPTLQHRVMLKMFSGKASKVSVESLIDKALDQAFALN
jgi:MoxR-like ATPase